jgi:acetoin:2,6-dichlorophenolindophenol oxidoreductase subunit alpha
LLSSPDIFFWREACRIYWFEERCHEALEDRRVQIFTYLASGQETVAPAIAASFRREKVNVFPQHRNHDSYISFGGDVVALRDELLGRETGTTKGIGGDPCHAFANDRVRFIGHSGFVADQVPIGVGMAYATKDWSIIFMGDSSCEEDVFGPSLGFVATHDLPVLFVCLDNDLSVITTKEKRRSWDVVNVAKGYGIDAIHLADDPFDIYSVVNGLLSLNRRSALINIRVQRKYFHVGAGKDSEMKYDRMQLTRDALSLIDPVKTKQIEDKAKREMEDLWAQV